MSLYYMQTALRARQSLGSIQNTNPSHDALQKPSPNLPTIFISRLNVIETFSLTFLEKNAPHILAFRDRTIGWAQVDGHQRLDLEPALDEVLEILSDPGNSMAIIERASYHSEHLQLIEHDGQCRQIEKLLSGSDAHSVALRKRHASTHESVIDHGWALVKKGPHNEKADDVFYVINETLKAMKYGDEKDSVWVSEMMALMPKLERAMALLTARFQHELDFVKANPAASSQLYSRNVSFELMFLLNFQIGFSQMKLRYEAASTAMVALHSTPLRTPLSMSRHHSVLDLSKLSPISIMSPSDRTPKREVSAGDSMVLSPLTEVESEGVSEGASEVSTVSAGSFNRTLYEELWSLHLPKDASTSEDWSGVLNVSISRYFSQKPTRVLSAPLKDAAPRVLASKQPSKLQKDMDAMREMVDRLRERYGRQPVLVTLPQAGGTKFVGPVKEKDKDEFLIGELHNSKGQVIERGFFFKNAKNEVVLMDGVCLDPKTGQTLKTVKRDIESIDWEPSDTSLNSLDSFRLHEFLAQDDSQVATVSAATRVAPVKAVTESPVQLPSNPSVAVTAPRVPVGPVWEKLPSDCPCPKDIVLGQKKEGDKVIEMGLYEKKAGKWQLIAGHRKQPDGLLRPWNPLLSRIGVLPGMNESWDAAVRKMNGLPPKKAADSSKVTSKVTFASKREPVTIATQLPSSRILKEQVTTHFKLDAVTVFRAKPKSIMVGDVVCGDVYNGSVLVARGLFIKTKNKLELCFGYAKKGQEFVQVRNPEIPSTLEMPHRVTGLWSAAQQTVGSVIGKTV